MPNNPGFSRSGQTEPTGICGAIVAVGVDRAEVEAITAEDPFLAALVESDPVRG